MMAFFILKLGCLAIYGMAIAGLAGLLPPEMAHTARNVALVMLVIHVLELAFKLRDVRRYRGPLAVSVLLTLLFGLLHWWPLAAQAKAHARTAAAAK